MTLATLKVVLWVTSFVGLLVYLAMGSYLLLFPEYAVLGLMNVCISGFGFYQLFSLAFMWNEDRKKNV